MYAASMVKTRNSFNLSGKTVSEIIGLATPVVTPLQSALNASKTIQPLSRKSW